MGRKRSRSGGRKKGGGVLSGLRGGFQGAVKGATGMGEGKVSSRANLFWNIVTGILLVLAAALFLRRCGVISF